MLLFDKIFFLCRDIHGFCQRRMRRHHKKREDCEYLHPNSKEGTIKEWKWQGTLNITATISNQVTYSTEVSNHVQKRRWPRAWLAAESHKSRSPKNAKYYTNPKQATVLHLSRSLFLNTFWMPGAVLTLFWTAWSATGETNEQTNISWDVYKFSDVVYSWWQVTSGHHMFQIITLQLPLGLTISCPFCMFLLLQCWRVSDLSPRTHSPLAVHCLGDLISSPGFPHLLMLTTPKFKVLAPISRFLPWMCKGTSNQILDFQWLREICRSLVFFLQ